MRVTLGNYLNQIVEVEGIYMGPAKKHEKTGLIFDKVLMDYPQYNGNVILSNNTPKMEGKKCPISFPEKTSYIVNIKGIGKFEDIEETHIILQEDISKKFGVKPRDEVQIRGIVKEYQRYSDGSIDYCLINPQKKYD